MSDETSTPPAQEAAHAASKRYGVLAIIITVVLVGFWLINRFAAVDFARDLQTWQEKLNLIAESRTADVNNWVGGNFRTLRSLAGNPSLQLYLTELESSKSRVRSSDGNDESGQRSYLRNLILFTADQSGFGAKSPTAVNANIPSESKNALAIINAEHEIVVSTAVSPSLAEVIMTQAKEQPPGQEYLIDIQKNPEGEPYIGFVVPIFAIQGERNAGAQIGQVVGIKTLDGNLFALLKHPGITEQTLESILVEVSGRRLNFISPLIDGSGPLSKEMVNDPDASAEAALARTVGNFDSHMIDYRNVPVLATSRSITNTPWKLIVKIDSKEALKKSTERRTGMVLLFFLIVAVVALLIASLWWYAHSKRAMMMSRHFRRLAAITRAQEQLLRLVTDHQPEPIYIVDTDQVYHFANHKAALASDMTAEFVVGKTLSDVLGANRANYVYEHCKKALATNRIVFDVSRHAGPEGEKVVRFAYVPLDHIPVISLPEKTAGVLVVEQDISEVMQERERRLGTQTHLIETLVRLVDKRDPFAANHSLLVSQLAHKIALDMELAPALVETARIAGCLMNIGKIVIPPNLLTKSGSLSNEEKQAIQESMQVAASIIKDIDFDGPVADTLKQWQEKWDGTGPLGLRGESILVSARIIAAANAFIGMISPRSWRTAIPIESATKFLLDQSDTHFDRRVVISLMNYVENHQGRAWIENILKNQRAA